VAMCTNRLRSAGHESDQLKKSTSMALRFIWDLAHSVGALAVDLAGNNVNFAVGCTYKYFNGGPGSPGFFICEQSPSRQRLATINRLAWPCCPVCI
ncbi:MAG: hypothetical protein LRY63_13580, partial [Nitrincola sp.]|nr:hypothetical protein [Nitrincola sp.]